MRIALTGASSTGKSTVCKALKALYPSLRVCGVDARSLLRSLGAQSVAALSAEQYAEFQRQYIARKESSEFGLADFITERSFVDAYAYWLLHCAPVANSEENGDIRDRCYRLSTQYDIHFFFPFGLVPFEPDGYRHPDTTYHAAISGQIESLLIAWNLPYETLRGSDLTSRVETVLRVVTAL